MLSKFRCVFSPLRQKFLSVQLRQHRKFSSYGQHDSYEEKGQYIKGIILANVLVSCAWWSAENTHTPSPSFMYNNFTISTHGFFRKHNYHTLVTALFSHIDPFHLAVNSFVLYSFGTNVINTLGTARFAFLYLGGGIVSSLAYVLWPYVIPKSWPAYHLHRDAPGLGASGAINSLLIWTVMRAPMNMFYFYGVIPVPAVAAGVGLVAMDAMGLYGGSTNNVGNIAHLAGAAFGAVYFLATKRFRRF